jgi:hypothetical protein
LKTAATIRAQKTNRLRAVKGSQAAVSRSLPAHSWRTTILVFQCIVEDGD